MLKKIAPLLVLVICGFPQAITPAMATKVIMSNACDEFLNQQRSAEAKWTWGSGSYAFEVEGMICLGFSRFVSMSGNSQTGDPFASKYFTSYTCSDGVKNPASCREDGSWNSTVIKTEQTSDQNGTFYTFSEPNGTTWWATRWRSW